MMLIHSDTRLHNGGSHPGGYYGADWNGWFHDEVHWTSHHLPNSHTTGSFTF